VLARLNRLHEPTAPSTSAYGNRTPSPNRQSLYDWAPSYNDGQDENELDNILNDLRRQQPDTHPDILRVLSETHLSRRQEGSGTPVPGMSAAEAAERRDRLRERDNRRRRESEWVNLRTRAAMQRARQESSPGATERMLRYVMERERSGMSEEEERARGSGWFRPSAQTSTESQTGAAAHTEHWTGARERERQERIEAFRRGYLAENVPPRLPRVSTPPALGSANAKSTTAFLENALQYLDDLRSIPSAEFLSEEDHPRREADVLELSLDHGLATKELWADKHDDFVMDLHSVEPAAESSWLQPGMVFDGHQHAAAVTSILHEARSRSSTVTHVLEQINPNYSSRPSSTAFDHPPSSTRLAQAFDASRPWLSHHPTIPGFYPLTAQSKSTQDSSTHDQWPVRVILHAVDPIAKTIQGTMEAYDVPQHTPAISSILRGGPIEQHPKAGKKDKPIVTYLEGEIIDLRTHSFLTPTCPSDNNEPNSSTNKRKRRSGPHPTSAENATPYTLYPTHPSFPSATPAIDAANWLKLPPFSDLTSSVPNTTTTSTPTPSSNPASDALARLLLSTSALNNTLESYIFMRWKERCFVHSPNDPCKSEPADRLGDQDRGHGLTISGFYYVSLRRSDGCVEGLYFDPTSTPYQCLRLQGRAGSGGAFGFA
jgi:hypothetical protein